MTSYLTKYSSESEPLHDDSEKKNDLKLHFKLIQLISYYWVTFVLETWINFVGNKLSRFISW